jgi:serine protease inhibitor
MLHRAPVAVMLVMLSLTWGCKRAETAPPKPTTQQPAAEEASAMSDRNLRFAFELFGKLHAEKPDGNLFVSPLSVSIALGMTCNGAAGSTRDAMLAALQWQGLDMAQVNQSLQSLKETLQSADPALKLTIADSLWADRGVKFKPGFLDVNRTFFDAEVATLDFADPASAERINGWVKDKTNGLIPEITTPADLAGMWMMLLDAVYFKGKWSTPFEKKYTQDATFTLLEGEKTVPMMEQGGEYRYLESDGWQAIALPYGNKRLQMIVVLPAKTSSLAELCGHDQAAALHGQERLQAQ